MIPLNIHLLELRPSEGALSENRGECVKRMDLFTRLAAITFI
jgi:hypothetical protein